VRSLRISPIVAGGRPTIAPNLARGHPRPPVVGAMQYDSGPESHEHLEGDKVSVAGEGELQVVVAPGAQEAFKGLHRKALDALQANLIPGEPVEVVILGPSNQAVIGTDRRAFIFKKGHIAGASFGAELTSWDYRNLVGVQLHTGMMTGAVILQGPGQSGTKTNTWGNKDDDPYKAPNAIPLNRPFDKAQAGVAALRQRIADAHNPSHPLPQSTPSIAPNLIADELMKLSQLRDSGVLTEDEFAQQKEVVPGLVELEWRSPA